MRVLPLRSVSSRLVFAPCSAMVCLVIAFLLFFCRDVAAENFSYSYVMDLSDAKYAHINFYESLSDQNPIGESESLPLSESTIDPSVYIIIETNYSPVDIKFTASPFLSDDGKISITDFSFRLSETTASDGQTEVDSQNSGISSAADGDNNQLVLLDNLVLDDKGVVPETLRYRLIYVFDKDFWMKYPPMNNDIEPDYFGTLKVEVTPG